jgi:hypothetical protein
MKPYDTETTFGENADGLFQKHSQVITDDFLESLKSERLAKAAMRSGEFERVASVPTFVWELWIREGRDPFNATAHQIVAWLKKDGLDAFIATPKRV